MRDEALVLRAREGDELAFRQLLDRYRLYLCRVVSDYFLQGGDREDLMQEARFGLYKAVRDYRSDRESSFRNFAELCVRRQVIVAVKTATRQKHMPLNGAQSFEMPVRQDQSRQNSEIRLIDATPGDALDPAEALIQREEVRVVAAAAGRLTKLETAAVLGIAEGYSYAEICDQTGSTHKQIDNAAQRGRQKVKAALEAAA